jgi:hypothetical protein
VDDEEDSDEEELYAGLPDDAAAREATAEQRTLLASFETQHRDESAWHFMHAWRTVAAKRLGDAQATAHATAHRRNIEAARAAMAAAKEQLTKVDRSWRGWRRWRRSAIAKKTSTPAFIHAMARAPGGAADMSGAPPPRAGGGGAPSPLRDGFPPTPVR